MSVYWIIGINFVTSLVMVCWVSSRVNVLHENTQKEIDDLIEIILRRK